MEINQEKIDAVRRVLYGSGVPADDVNRVTNAVCQQLTGKTAEEFCEDTEGYFTPTLEVEWDVYYDGYGKRHHSRSCPFEDYLFNGDKDIADFKSDFLLFLEKDCRADMVLMGTHFTVCNLTFSKHDAFGDEWLMSEDDETYYWDGDNVVPEIN